MITLLVHISNEESIKLDVEELPRSTDTAVIGRNPRDKTEKEPRWLEEGVSTIIIPLWRITFVEVLPSAAEESDFPLPFRIN